MGVETETVCLIAARILGLDPASVSERSMLIDDLGADSLDMMKIAVEIEERTQRPIDPKQLREARTVGDLAFFMMS